MVPTSVKGIRRMIVRRQKRAKKNGAVPSWMTEALDKALELKPDKVTKKRPSGIPKDLLKPRPFKPRYKVLVGTTLGKASKGRTLTGEELEQARLKLMPRDQ